MLDCKATLRVKSEVLTLADISSVLGKPTKGFTKGQEYGAAKKLREHTQWSLVVGEDDNLSLQECILKVIDFASDKRLETLKGSCEVDIFCMLSSDNGQGSFTFDASIYERLVSAGLSITFDFYSD